MDRRSLIAGGLGALAAAVAPATVARAAAAPYPPADGVRLERLDPGWLWRRACESDQWPHVAVGGSRILAAWGDGYGWAKRRGEAKAFLGTTAISGTAQQPVGTDTWSDAGSAALRRLKLKPCALLKVGDACAIYAAGSSDGRDATRLLRGTAAGKGFALAAGEVVRRSVHGLQVVGAVHHAPGDARGDLVLLLAEHGNLPGPQLYAGPRNARVWAARVAPATLAAAAEWEWFCGLDGAGATLWSRAAVRGATFMTATAGLEVVPAFADPAGCGKHVMVSWCPSAGGYVLAKTQERVGLGLFLGPTPFGPWRTLFHGPFVPTDAQGLAHIFTAQVVAMWSQGDVLALMWGGHPGFSTNCAAPNQETNYDAAYLTRFAVRRD